MTHADKRGESAADDPGLVDLGAASAVTRGPIAPIVFEPFAFLPFAGLSKD